ncbi:TPA: glucose-6-phosphate isomerase [Candidatus Scatousia excrementigallinarum]|uniref:Glucose-6-phosphate isomerase n=1 Tax=Candidatus Scatousia excrementigallinarum TaxID=2840935 RepID=A0A9D1EZG2_9BACT|nr:glucose-6-phosphate isomerase [Candidatus Scatousia excrementigallinarum]
MIDLCCRNVDASVIGQENGLELETEFAAYKDIIAGIIASLNQRKDKPGQWLQWMNLGYNEETIWYVKEYASMVKDRFENILVLGIGGSALGGIALTEALLKPYWNILSDEQREGLPRIFFLDNIDPDTMTGLLSFLDLKKTLVNVITKSGSTAETMSQFMIVKDLLEKELGDNYRYNVVATTDKRTGILRQIAEQEGYKTFVVPDDVGGRFSVFSAVGLLPLALVGIDIDSIVNGIKDMDLALKNTDINENIAAQNALIHFLMDTKKGKNLSVMMPYSSRLKYVSDWYAQLWAESLGKNKDIDGNNVNIGPTPIKALGVTDQHSQIQLYNEGPNNKIINFIRVKEFDNTLDIPNIFEYTGLNYLGGKTMNQLLNAEADSTRVALADYGRPTVTITLPKVDGYNVAQLLYMFEVQTAIAGELYKINTFNQPGVEQAKNYTYALMGRAGYEDSAQTLKEKMGTV